MERKEKKKKKTLEDWMTGPSAFVEDEELHKSRSWARKKKAQLVNERAVVLANANSYHSAFSPPPCHNEGDAVPSSHTKCIKKTPGLTLPLRRPLEDSVSINMNPTDSFEGFKTFEARRKVPEVAVTLSSENESSTTERWYTPRSSVSPPITDENDYSTTNLCKRELPWGSIPFQ